MVRAGDRARHIGGDRAVERPHVLLPDPITLLSGLCGGENAIDHPSLLIVRLRGGGDDAAKGITKPRGGVIMINKIPMTADGYNRLREELRRLKTIDRPAIIRAVAEARTPGDMEGSAEYHAARDRQSFIEGRVIELEDKIARAEVIDVSKLSGSVVKFGAKVTLADEETDEEQTFQIVGEDEADIKAGRLSVTSPLARALIGKGKGESVEVTTPRGPKSYEIVTVAFG